MLFERNCVDWIHRSGLRITHDRVKYFFENFIVLIQLLLIILKHYNNKKIGGDGMTTDAIAKVKEAEIKAKKIVDDAKTKASLLKKEAENNCKDISDKIVKDAKKKSEDLKFSYRNEGEMLSKPIIEKAEKDVSLIKSVDEEKLESVVNSIVERIVSMNGNS